MLKQDSWKVSSRMRITPNFVLVQLSTHSLRIYCLHNLTDFVTLRDTKNVTLPPGLDYSDDPFYNHVFLEHHLEPWCPRSGPIRQFMETVCLGLSQNPYMASQKKIDTIMWFKDYFEKPDHKEILVHAGCWEDSEDVEVSH